MDCRALAARIERSAEDLYWYQDARPELAESVVEADSCDVFGGYAVVHLPSRLGDFSGVRLRVGSRTLGEEESGLERYDEVSRTVIARPPAEALGAMAAGEPVALVSNMNFLVRAAGDFYRAYGGMLGLPPGPADAVEPEYPEGGRPTRAQEEAAGAVCSSALSYVWGAPGTGKTQFVLSSCIRGCLAKGMRVAVFAPTNNSVEQVLRGIIASFPDGPPEGVVRLGVPTAGFLSEHPGMCEDRQAQRRYDECLRSMGNLEEVRYERRCDAVAADLAALRSVEGGLWDRADLEGRRPDLAGCLDRVEAVCRMRPSTAALAEDAGPPLSRRLDRIEAALYARDRCAANISEYSGWSDADLESEIGSFRSQAEALRGATTAGRLSSARIIASTPHQFISRFRPRGSPEGPRPELDVDMIFVDEAGYCGLVQALALFTNGVPVAMFGDHMQLPPVEQLEDDIARAGAVRGGLMQDMFLWNMPAVHAEALLTDGPDALRADFLAGSPPRFRLTARRDLTESRRFGANLASILDRLVYRNGLTGDPLRSLRIDVVDARCDGKEDRRNPAEALAVRRLLDEERPDPASVCVLTPYKKQRNELKRAVRRRYADCVMTVHGSQGREWDTVVLSVSDNRVPVRDVPYRFTSSKTPIGMRLMNTAVSRAKERLVLVCDAGFWAGLDDELLGALARAGGRVRSPLGRPPRFRGRPLSCGAGP